MANTTNLSFSKLTTVPSLNLIPGRIYFETSTGLIKIAKVKPQLMFLVELEMLIEMKKQNI